MLDRVLCGRSTVLARRAMANAGVMPERGKWPFLLAFALACFLFWWMRCILLRTVFHLSDSVDDSTIAISVLAFFCFSVAYLTPRRSSASRWFSEATLDSCADFSYRVTVALFLPALLMAAQLFLTNAKVDYGSSDPIPRPYQALLYSHLFFGFLCLGAADPDRLGRRPLVIASILLTLPRLIISLHGARFFLAQAVVPLLIIAIGRGWVRFTLKRITSLAIVGLFIIFVPAITRGDNVVSEDGELQLFMGSDILGLFQNNTGLSYEPGCPPLLISLTAKVVPYGLLGVCVIDSGGLKNLPATVERILTNNDPRSYQGTAAGTGSNYLLELYITGGLFAVYLGSALFGFSCRTFVRWTGRRSLFSGIWAECLTRALLAPRGNLGYVFERIPSLMAATVALVFVIWIHHHIQESCLGRAAGPCES
jgi:hypothetical protein